LADRARQRPEGSLIAVPIDSLLGVNHSGSRMNHNCPVKLPGTADTARFAGFHKYGDIVM
jgi:hypothetical protein